LVKNEVGQQRARNVLLEKEIAVLDQHVNEIKKLKEHREELELKMSAIRGLRNERPLIVHYFDEMVKLVPDGVYFNSLNNKEMLFEISGVADSKNRVSELMRGLEKSPFFFSTNLKSVVKNGFKLTVNAAIPEEFYKLVEE
jgi:type IV pilus assembly protein PilN